MIKLKMIEQINEIRNTLKGITASVITPILTLTINVGMLFQNIKDKIETNEIANDR